MGVQCNKVQESSHANHGSAMPSNTDTAPLLDQDANASCASCDCGLMTTAAVKPGELLISVPQHAAVVADHPEQITLQLATLAFDEAACWYSTAASAQAQHTRLSQQAEEHVKAAGLAIQQHGATSISQEQLLRCLVASWGSSGRVEWGLPSRLLLAQMWPDRKSSPTASNLSEALAGDCDCTVTACSFWPISCGQCSMLHCALHLQPVSIRWCSCTPEHSVSFIQHGVRAAGRPGNVLRGIPNLPSAFDRVMLKCSLSQEHKLFMLQVLPSRMLQCRVACRARGHD